MPRTLLLLLIGVLCSCAEARTLCAIGDSITYGYATAETRVTLPPPEALHALLRRTPREHPWRRARVLNLGVSASWTGDWLTGPPKEKFVCTQQDLPAHARYACERGLSLLDALEALGTRCDGYLVMLGLNDGFTGFVGVETSVDNLDAIARRLGRERTWIAAPTQVTNPVLQHRRTLLRDLLVARGLLTGIDPPMLPLLADGIHLNDPGAAALGGLWFGHLR